RAGELLIEALQRALQVALVHQRLRFVRRRRGLCGEGANREDCRRAGSQASVSFHAKNLGRRIRCGTANIVELLVPRSWKNRSVAVRVLVVKTSSLGDVIHALPALTDAKSALPDVTCDWVVEKAFSEIPAWHPAVGRVVTCELRRWRKHPLAALRSGEWRNFVGELRRTRYDVVLDAQGLLKSAWLATRARGTRIGPGFASAREPFAAMFYDRRIGLPSHDQAHAVDRMRRLFAAALGYAVPDRPPDF